MATSGKRRIDRDILVETGSVIGVCTVTLTAVFVGLVGLLSGEATGMVTRLPLYVLVSSLVFLAALIVMDHSQYHGQTILIRALVGGIAGFLVVTLGTEGIVYALTHPERVVVSHLFVYLLSAAIIASGIGYWSVLNWRDVNKMINYSRL
jgi:hypothetical protein